MDKQIGYGPTYGTNRFLFRRRLKRASRLLSTQRRWKRERQRNELPVPAKYCELFSLEGKVIWWCIVTLWDFIVNTFNFWASVSNKYYFAVQWARTKTSHRAVTNSWEMRRPEWRQFSFDLLIDYIIPLSSLSVTSVLSVSHPIVWRPSVCNGEPTNAVSPSPLSSRYGTRLSPIDFSRCRLIAVAHVYRFFSGNDVVRVQHLPVQAHGEDRHFRYRWWVRDEIVRQRKCEILWKPVMISNKRLIAHWKQCIL